MGGTNSFSINNYNLSDQEEDSETEYIDPEALTPMPHFSNTQGGLASYKSPQEESKDPVSVSKKKRRQLQISV